MYKTLQQLYLEQESSVQFPLLKELSDKSLALLPDGIPKDVAIVDWTDGTEGATTHLFDLLLIDIPDMATVEEPSSEPPQTVGLYVEVQPRLLHLLVYLLGEGLETCQRAL